MGGLLEILGRAITIETPGLIWHWLSERREAQSDTEQPENPHLDHIIDLMGYGKFSEAREQVRLYLFANPSCCYGRMAAAALLLQDDNLKDAMEELNSVYMRQPSNTLALYLLGHCFERLGQQAQADRVLPGLHQIQWWLCNCPPSGWGRSTSKTAGWMRPSRSTSP